MKPYKYLDTITAAFVGILLVSNVASSAKIIDWGVSLLGIRLSFDAGTLLFPLSYIFGDILTEVYGYARARKVIWTGFVAAAVMCGLFYLISIMPGESTWQEYAGDAAFKAILSGVFTGGIKVASLGAYFAGEFINSFVLAKLKILTAGRFLWVRTIGSTLVGELVDSAIFVSLACLFGVFPWSIAISLILANYVFKTLIEVLMTPVTYRIVAFLKKREEVDWYDRDTNFNPFRLFGNETVK